MDCYDDMADALPDTDMCDDGEQLLMELNFGKMTLKKKRKFFHVVFRGVGETTKFLRTFRTKVAAAKYIYDAADFCADMDGNIINPHSYLVYDCECPMTSDCGKNKTTVVRCIARNNGWQDYDIMAKKIDGR